MPEDYSPTIKDTARRLVASGQAIQRTGNLIKGTPSKIDVPKATRPPTSAPKTPSGTTSIDGHVVAAWIAPIVLWVRKRGVWKGVVTSGVRTVAEQRQACRNVCGNPDGCPGRCAKPGTSNHQGTVYPAGAVDVSDYVTFRSEVARYPHSPTIKNDLPSDRVHFSASGH